MRVFVTGASGFVGSAVVQELLNAGHQVLGLARSEKSADAIKKAGAEVYLGNRDDPKSLQQGAAECEAVIHTAFNHDFSRYAQSCEDDRQVILALGEALAGTGRPLVVTSGVGIMSYNRMITEADKPVSTDATSGDASANAVPRAASEEGAIAVNEQGGNAYIVRLPPSVHGEGDNAFVPIIIRTAREKGESVYLDEGQNKWAAVHRLDAAAMYRLIIEQQPEQRVYHAVAEEGIAFKDIAEAVGQGLQVPVLSKDNAGADAHFGWFKHFAAIDCQASSEQSKTILGWQPKQVRLLEDMATAGYF